MDKKTRKALRASIKHWEENVHYAKTRQYKKVSVSDHHCALCREFKDCEGCPVSADTGRAECHGSPYWSAREILFGGRFDGLGYSGLTEACRKELNFLKSLDKWVAYDS